MIVKRLLMGLVKAYRLLLSPWLGGSCRFEPTCSAYALQALRPAWRGSRQLPDAARIARCQPWCDGGHDPVPRREAPAVFPAAFPHLDKEVFMNDIRRTILWVIFGFSMVMLWDQWQVYNGNKATFFPSPAKTAASASAGSTRPAPAASGVPTASATPPAAGGDGGRAGARHRRAGSGQPAAPRERIEVVTDVLKLTFDTAGRLAGQVGVAQARRPGGQARKPPCCWTRAATASTWPRPA